MIMMSGNDGEDGGDFDCNGEPKGIRANGSQNRFSCILLRKTVLHAGLISISSSHALPVV